MNNRITYFDFLRGVAILMVIGIHSYYVVPFDSIGNVLRIILREGISFAVPLFLAISGFFIVQKRMASRYDYFLFLKKQLPRVYIPLLWSTPMVVLWIIKGKVWFIAIFQGMVCAAFGPYYFILLIIQFYVFHPFIVRAVNNKMGRVFLLFINIVSFILFNIILIKYNLPFVFLVSPCIYWISFYSIGVYLYSHNRDYSIKKPVILISIGAIAQLISCFYTKQGITESQAVLVGWLYSVSAWAYEMGIIFLFFAKVSERLYNEHAPRLSMIKNIGSYAFGIYLCHVYVQKIIEDFTTIDTWLYKWIVMTILSISFIFMIGGILPKKYHKYLGIQ